MATSQIDHVTRLRNSVNGNPRYTIHFGNGMQADTQSDASINYDVENLRVGKRLFPGVYSPFDLFVTYSRAGKIINMEVV